MGRETSVFSTEGLSKEAIEDGDNFVASPRRKARIPGTLGISRVESVRRRCIDGKGSAVIGDLVKVWDELGAKITDGGCRKDRKLAEERLKVFVWGVMLVSEEGQEGGTVDMEITKTEGVIERHAIFVADGIPGRDQTSTGIHDNVSIGVNIEIGPVRTMRILMQREGRRGERRIRRV